MMNLNYDEQKSAIGMEIKTITHIFEECADRAYVSEYIKEIKNYEELKHAKLIYLLRQLQEYCRRDYEWEEEFKKLDKLIEHISEFEKQRELEEEKVEPFNKFWVSFNSWMENELPYNDILNEQYIYYDNLNGGTFYCNINYDEVFRTYLGISYKNEYENKDKCEFSDLKILIELLYKELIKVGKRYDFTVKINDMLKSFQLPYELKKGKFIKKGYKGTTENKIIIDYQMLESKILWAEDRIMGKEILDKHTALNYITDALDYLLSLINSFDKAPFSKKGLAQKCALLVSEDENSKLYSVIKDEINQIRTIVNEYFDIRHNEYLSKISKSKREALTNPAVIEYLFNRIYTLLILLKNMYVAKCKDCDDEKTVSF